MAAQILTLHCKDCGKPFGIAVIPDKEQLKSLIDRKYKALLSFVPDDLDLSGITNLPVLCAGCAQTRGMIPPQETGNGPAKEGTDGSAESGNQEDAGSQPD